MPSKGVQCYTYIAVPGCTIELSVPGQTVVKKDLRTFWNADLEVDAKNIRNLFDKTGRFSFKVLRNGELITEQWIEVNALTGRLGDGTMRAIANTPSVLHGGDLIVSYGFYAAGNGEAGLPNRHQCYVTVSPDNSDWMAAVAPPGSSLEAQPLGRMVLPSAHDVGMNSMQNADAVLQHAGGAVVSKLIPNNDAVRAIIDALSGPAIALIAPNIVFSLAITQKDSLETMLRLGARYFEFRPAHCHRDVLPALPIPDELYFQHGAVPGMAYRLFLAGLVAFLAAHPAEIVVVQLRWDGVPNECARPSAADLRDYLAAALATTTPPLVAGGIDDLRGVTTIAQLRRAGRRLVVLDGGAVDPLSTYTDAGNATVTGDSIVDGFARALQQTPGSVAGRVLVELQCQATASNVPGAVAYSVLSAGASTSCLLATKALCDAKTLPWVRDNVLAACGREALVVVMNDFLDGATADVAIGLCGQRLK